MKDGEYDAASGSAQGALSHPARDELAAIAAPAPARGAEASGEELDRLTLRFASPLLESAFLADLLRRNLTGIRAACVLGALLWVVWGVMVSPYLSDQRGFDLIVRYGILIPVAVLALALSFTRFYAREWEAVMFAVLLIEGLVWVVYSALVRDMPIDYGYVGVILIMTFSYTLVRLRFIPVLALSAILVTGYVAAVFAFSTPDARRLMLAGFYLLSFWFLGMIGSYTLERSSRLLVLRDRQLDQERMRSDALLLNVLPQVIVDRLKLRQPEAGPLRVADGFQDVSVLFADAVGFTGQAARIAPDDLVDALDTLFSRFDVLADRHGLEEDQDRRRRVHGGCRGASAPRRPRGSSGRYGARDPRDGARCPMADGRPIEVRIGIAAGPVVAGVIGRRKFSYDLWGDTVNLASRLESHGEPGCILVSEGIADPLRDRYRFGPSHLVELKGKGPTPACFLLGRIDDAHLDDGDVVADV